MAKTNLKGLSLTRIALVDKGASFDPKTGDGAHVLIFKRAAPADGDDTMADKITLADITKALATLTPADKESLQKALGAAPAPEDILKNADPAVRALVEKAQKDAKDANDRATANETAIAEITKATRIVEVRKRVDVFKHLSGDKAVLADVLRTVEDSDKDLAKKFEEILKAHDVQLEKGGVVKPGVGSRGTGEGASGGDGSAYSEIEKLADALVQKGDGKTTKADAITAVLSDPANADLYQRHVDETRVAGTRDSK